MKKFRFVLPLLAVMIVVVASAFTVYHPATVKPVTADRYHFTESTADNIYDAAKWEPADPMYPSCNGNGLPCVISITGDLQDFLDQAESNGGVADIQEVAESLQE